jgi:hypothetical protein
VVVLRCQSARLCSQLSENVCSSVGRQSAFKGFTKTIWISAVYIDMLHCASKSRMDQENSYALGHGRESGTLDAAAKDYTNY